jgi:hypothetical protein
MAEIIEKLKKLQLDQVEIRNKLKNLEDQVDTYEKTLNKVKIKQNLFNH